MPELPDVETFRRYLGSTALHARIRDVTGLDEGMLGDIGGAQLRRALRGGTLDETRRHGKWLFVRVGAAGWLVLHFGMTGDLKYSKDGDRGEHARLLLRFDDGYRLAYRSRRRLGSIDLTDGVEDFVAAHGLGPDALAVEWTEFRDLLGGRRGRLKTALMDQSVISGIGNIYGDEICFQAHLHPAVRPDALDERVLRRVYTTMRRVLSRAVEGRADPGEMPRGWLIGRRHEGDACPRCGGSVERLRIGGRSSYICPACQPSD